MTGRPSPDEYAPYYETYISRIPSSDIIGVLKEQTESFLELLRHTPESKYHYRYDDDKWSVKEVLGHITDSEQIFGYRLLCIARGDTSSLPGFDQDRYVEKGAFDRISWMDLVVRFELLRRANITFMHTLTETEWLLRGTANNFPVSARSLAYTIAGHTDHHIFILKSRYLS